jgi:DNA repair photolyase
MNIKEISSKTALTPSRLPGLTYALNPYLGCMHQCRYCYAPGILHRSYHEWETEVNVKRNLPLVLSKELKQKKPGTIGLSTVTDPYQPIEQTYKITKYCLEVLLKHRFPLCIQTKSDLILRDIEIINQCFDVEVMVSIGTLHDEHRKILEPHSSSISKRLTILRTFSQMNVKTSVFFGPIYPTITEDEIPEILDTFLDCGVDEIMIDCLHPKKDIIPLLTKTIQHQPEFQGWLESFNTHSPDESFQKMRKTIHEYLKGKDVIIKDAF